MLVVVFKIALKCFIPISFESLFLFFFTGQESCLSFVGVQNVLRAILIELVGWIISPTMSVTDRVIDPNLQYWRPPRYVISYHQRCSLSHLHTNYSKTLKE